MNNGRALGRVSVQTCIVLTGPINNSNAQDVIKVIYWTQQARYCKLNNYINMTLLCAECMYNMSYIMIAAMF